MDYVDSVLPTEQVRWIILWQHVRVQVLCIIHVSHVLHQQTTFLFILPSTFWRVSWTSYLIQDSSQKKFWDKHWKKFGLDQNCWQSSSVHLLSTSFNSFCFILHNESNDITVHFLVNLWKNEWNHQPADVLIAPLPGVGLTIQTYNKKE